jgi:hypothetical protein
MPFAANLRNDAGRIESEDRGELRQRQVGEPLRPFRKYVLEIRHDSASLDGDEDIRRARFGYRDLLEQQRPTDLVQASYEHGVHSWLLWERLEKRRDSSKRLE